MTAAVLMLYGRAFVVGGLICVVAQLLLDLAKLNPAHVMVSFVCLGAIISGVGLYQPLVDIGGAGATVPLTGFGHALYQGIVKEVGQAGVVGLLTGGLRATALGITVAVASGVLVAILCNPKG
jgi:stage V sporulation protein AE